MPGWFLCRQEEYYIRKMIILGLPRCAGPGSPLQSFFAAQKKDFHFDP